MTDGATDLGPPIARGRAADVYAYGDGLVLRRYRTLTFLLYEAAVMSWVANHSYPVPKVVWTSGLDLVMERLDGPTMLADLASKPWRLFKHAATLADLLKRLHEIPPAPWLLPKHAEGDDLVHLDLHPDNVMLTSRGPVVIDWTNSGRGDGNAEIADLWLVMSCASIPGGGVQRLVGAAGQGLFTRAVLSHFDRDPIRRKLAAAAELRSRDRNMSAAEIERMHKRVAKSGL